MPGEYTVGKGKPPAHARWRKGQSGNPKGRPRKKRPDAASVVGILDESIAVRQGGAARRMPAFEVSVRKLVSRALNEADVSAALEFLRLCDKYGVITPTPEPVTSGNVTIPRGTTEWYKMMADIVGLDVLRRVLNPHPTDQVREGDENE